MSTDELTHTQRNWSEQALFLMRDLLPLMVPFAQHPAWTSAEQQTLGLLLTASARATESTMLLLAYGQLWDAEVVLRSVCEATLKFVYIIQSSAEFKTRIREYSDDLFNISRLKDDQKATELLEALGSPDSREWKPIRDLLLSSEERETLSQRYDRSTRRALDTRWGFTGLIGALRRSQDPSFKGVSGLLHGYSVASHIHHADYHGVSVPIERSMRDPERRSSVHLAHLARLLSDAFAYFLLRLGAAYRFIGHDPSPIENAQSRIDLLKVGFGAPYEAWMDIEYPQR